MDRSQGPVTLVLVRHGRTEWNATGRFQGQADPDLDDVGRGQAEAAATRIAAMIEGGVAPAPSGAAAVALSSDLRRARSTAAAIARATGTPVRVDRRLREIDIGGWEGLTEAEVTVRFPDEWSRWKSGEPVRRGGGESEEEAGTRVASAILEAAAEQPSGSEPAGRCIVVVGHGLSLQAGMHHLHEKGHVTLEAGAPHLDNGEILVSALAVCPTPTPLARIGTVG